MLFKTRQMTKEEAMDNAVRKFYDFLMATNELKRFGVTIDNHNTFKGDVSTAELRDELVKKFNNAAKDAFGK